MKNSIPLKNFELEIKSKGIFFFEIQNLWKFKIWKKTKMETLITEDKSMDVTIRNENRIENDDVDARQDDR